MGWPQVSGFFVAFEGSYEDPERQGGLSGPYPTHEAARDWVDILQYVRDNDLQDNPKRPLFIIRARFKMPQVGQNAFDRRP